MATTTNFGWETPDDTDLVKDGAAAMRTLGNSIDASFVDLKGGTTGQVLSKNSNTDLDFTWVAQDDSNAIQNSIVDAKGDLIAASAADTPARLAVGNDGETLVADSSATTGLRWQGNFAAGKNAILNGDFRINQRAFSSSTTSGAYGFDRWQFDMVGAGTTYSAQTFTPGTAPVAGYEAINFARIVTSGYSASSSLSQFYQKIEDVRTFAGQTITISFWAKAASGTPKLLPYIAQNFGSGGSPSSEVFTYASSTQTITTSWARYSFTIAVPSISGKTIGTTANTSYLRITIVPNSGSDYAGLSGVGVQNNTFDLWGVQVEAGNVATAFQTATGTLAGEFQACARYYYRYAVADAYQHFGVAYASATTVAQGLVNLPVTMRTNPSSVDVGGTIGYFQISNGVDYNLSSISLVGSAQSPQIARITGNMTGATLYSNGWLRAVNSSTAYIGFSAEL